MSSLTSPSTSSPVIDPEGSTLSRRLTTLLALACGVGVANIYFPQAITPLIAAGLRVSRASAALAVTGSQLGYAVGIFLLLPLGDRLVHRRFIPCLLTITALGLILAGLAPSLPVLLAATLIIGAATVVPQVIIPMAAGLVAEDRRGHVTGVLLSGLIGGILLARAFSGLLGQWLGWRAPYLVAACAVLALAVALARTLPRTRPTSSQRYPQLVIESLRLLRAEPELRRSCLYQATIFAAFNAAWTTIALYLTAPAYGLGTSAVGLIALVGAGSMCATPAVGRRIDSHGPDGVNLIAILGAIAAAAVLTLGDVRGPLGLAALTAGMLLLDVAMQSGQVANQMRVFGLRPDARARLNTAYMTCAFLGGSAGSLLGVRAYDSVGWLGVCGLIAVLSAIALARHLAHQAHSRHRRSSQSR